MPLLKSLIQAQPLLISSLIQYAAQYHGEREIVTRTINRDIHRTTYAEVYKRTQQLANALEALGQSLEIELGRLRGIVFGT